MTLAQLPTIKPPLARATPAGAAGVSCAWKYAIAVSRPLSAAKIVVLRAESIVELAPSVSPIAVEATSCCRLRTPTPVVYWSAYGEAPGIAPPAARPTASAGAAGGRGRAVAYLSPLHALPLRAPRARR